MDKFETQFTDLDVQTSYLENTMSSTTATTTPQDEVDTLMSQVADEAGLEIQQELGGLGADKLGDVGAKEKAVEKPEEDDRLAERCVPLSFVIYNCLSGKLAADAVFSNLRVFAHRPDFEPSDRQRRLPTPSFLVRVHHFLGLQTLLFHHRLASLALNSVYHDLLRTLASASRRSKEKS